jgi:hypothetical protein
MTKSSPCHGLPAEPLRERRLVVGTLEQSERTHSPNEVFILGVDPEGFECNLLVVIPTLPHVRPPTVIERVLIDVMGQWYFQQFRK